MSSSLRVVLEHLGEERGSPPTGRMKIQITEGVSALGGSLVGKWSRILTLREEVPGSHSCFLAKKCQSSVIFIKTTAVW